MPDPKDTEGTTPEPTPQQPRAEQPTTPLPATDPQPAQPTDPEHVATASAAEPPPPGSATPPPHVAAAGPAYATAPPPRRRFRQVVAHRATQLVAVGVLGLIIGGGLVALLDHDGYRGNHGRPGISRMDDRGAPGPAPRPGPHGPGWDDRGHFER